jgi:hypothetical protein
MTKRIEESKLVSNMGGFSRMLKETVKAFAFPLKVARKVRLFPLNMD